MSASDDEKNNAPPEPEGGPLARGNAFLLERMTPLRPKEKDDQPPEAPSPTIASIPTRKEKDAPGDSDAAENRHKAIRRYRERVKKSDQPLRGSAAMMTTEGSAPPPMPPAPPPANNWIPIGPSVLRKGQGATLPATSGRTPGVAPIAGTSRVYIAAANGGVWRSEDIGESWVSLMDAFDLNPTSVASDSLSCGALAVIPGANAATDRIYVGSGEGQGGAYMGVGPVVSFDGGSNWTTETSSPSLAGSAFYALAVNPLNSESVVGATRKGLYLREMSGPNVVWNKKTVTGALSSVFTSVVATVKATTVTYYAACNKGPVFNSADGVSWSILGTGFPTTNVGRIGLAAQPSNPDVVYALIANSSDGSLLGVWRYDSSSNAWLQISGAPSDLFGTSSIGYQGSYDLAITVDPNDVNLLYLGGSTKSSGGQWSGSIYRSAVASSGSGNSLSYSMTNTYIGASTHADIHTLVFTPGDSNKLWVGCDGGVYYSTNPKGTGNIFIARNTGLQTLTMNHIDHHPTEDAVVFCGTQDNGGGRFTGEEAWLHSVWGDSGFFVINWADPYRILATYVRASVNRNTDGGTRYNYTSAAVPVTSDDKVLFYAPLVGTPYNPSVTSQAERVAFGSNRVWLSDAFGSNWQSIPNNDSSDFLGASNDYRIRSLLFATYDKLYAGTMNGQVHRYDKSVTGWTRTRIDNLGGLGLAGVVTDIAMDQTDATGNSIYISFGGNGDYRHVWHFNGTTWEARSGPSGTPGNQLLDVQHNAIVTDSANPDTLYAGADIGIWSSTDGGANWGPYSDGLPDAAVIDLKLHGSRRLLRASTYGRGVFERTIDQTSANGIELYVRDTQLDQGRMTTVNYLPDPTDINATVRHWRGPDIKVDTPDSSGNYQFPLTGSIDFYSFVEVLSDDYSNVATSGSGNIVTRVYAQIHNRGVTPANNVRVMCLLANASAGLPALPANHATSVQNGTSINTADWKTLGMVYLNNLRVGFPQVAAFSLNSTDLPPPADLSGNSHFCVLILVHHDSDPYTSSTTNTDSNSMQNRKAAHKNLTVVEFTGTMPASEQAPMVVPICFYNTSTTKNLLTGISIEKSRFPGTIRLITPTMQMSSDSSKKSSNLTPQTNFAGFSNWATKQLSQVEKLLKDRKIKSKEWYTQRSADVQAAVKGTTYQAKASSRAYLGGITMPKGSRHTVFLMFDPPRNVKPGQSFEIDLVQWDESKSKKSIIGGMTTRVKIVDKPKKRV